MTGEPSLEVVCSLNKRARLLGLRHGMTRVEVDTFVEPVVLARSLEAERATKAILLECAGAFSPRVEDRSQARTFVWADIAATQSLFGPSEMLGKNLRQRVRTLGISGQVTVSSNFHAAVCIAKGLMRSGLQVAQQGKEAAAPSSLPVTVLGLLVRELLILPVLSWARRSLPHRSPSAKRP